MSFTCLPRASDIATVGATSAQDEWVEIIEPNSKTKFYANLKTGLSVKSPPDGAVVLSSEDFSDHWWEVYDKETGQYYYYNPEQQVTVWTKPVAKNNGDSKKLLIIPVSKLNFSVENQSEKCDASTQTIASNLISTGTQTINQTSLDKMLNEKLTIHPDIENNHPATGGINHLRNDIKDSDNPMKLITGQRQSFDSTGKYRNPYLRTYQRQATIAGEHPHATALNQPDHYNKKRYGMEHEKNVADLEAQLSQENSYFAPMSSQQMNRRSMHIQTPSTNFSTNRRDDMKSTSTFKNISQFDDQSHNRTSKNTDNTDSKDQAQQMVTNNLSHYLVREARAMGIALISDDEIEDDDQDSDDECHLDEDEDTDIRDDFSNHRIGDLNASEDLADDSSEGWKSLSEQGSPNRLTDHGHRTDGIDPKESVKSRSARCQNHSLMDLPDDDLQNPSANMSQQLDHRKLVQNFKKSRQTSALSFNDPVGRSYKLESSQAVQKIKAVADSYFKHGDKTNGEKLTEKHLRQISALSTLPRLNKETKEKGNVNGEIIDADYDVVEENCGYYSDSESGLATSEGTSTKNTVSSKTKNSDESNSAVSYFDRNKTTRGSTFSVESFARENLSRHPRGGLLFNRKVKWSRMISWTKSSIKQPMISSVSSDHNPDAIASFKLIQQFMGDRKITIGKRYRQVLSEAGLKEETYSHRRTLGLSTSLNVSSNSNSSHVGSANASNPEIPCRLRDELAYELACKGCLKSQLRDEIFVQLARQLTDNPSHESTSSGLVLMSILLSYFSPSSKFAPFLMAFLEGHSHPMARDVAMPRLEKRLRQSAPTHCRKPTDGKEISIVRLSITKWPQYCGVFGQSLERIMSLQACSPYLKTLRLPWILTTLGEKLVETGGFETEGIFRCAADHDLLAQLRLEIDCVDFRKITDAKQVNSLLSNVQDPHVIAGLLKLFFRLLSEPVFPTRIHDICLSSCQDNQMACRVFTDRLPNLNKDVVAYLIRLLQLLSESDKVTKTKMDTSNLSMVWAPNLLRAPELASTFVADSRDGSKWSIANPDEQTSLNVSTATSTTPSQSMIFEHARQEMQFIKALIAQLDTSFIKDVL